MILVTLGTNDKTFIRLIKKIEELKIKGVIDGDVVVQAGFTKYESEHMQIFDLIDMDKFNELIKKQNKFTFHNQKACGKPKKISQISFVAKQKAFTLPQFRFSTFYSF